MLCKDNCLHFFYNLRMLVGHIVVFVNVRSQIVKERYTFLHYYFPFIARWPGHVPAGKVNDHICAFYDLMPTFCDVAGIKNYEKKYRNKEKEVDYFDGISFAPTLLGKKKQKQHDFLYWEFNETNQIAVRMDDWKLIVKKGKPFLYNLKTDIHEDNDVALQHPDIVEKLKKVI